MVQKQKKMRNNTLFESIPEGQKREMHYLMMMTWRNNICLQCNFKIKSTSCPKQKKFNLVFNNNYGKKKD